LVRFVTVTNLDGRRLLKALIHLYEEEKVVLFNIYEFSSGEELLEEIEKHDIVFDVLFLDNSMKKLTGLETARLIRQFESTSACSIVFVTSADDHDQFMQVKPLQVISYANPVPRNALYFNFLIHNQTPKYLFTVSRLYLRLPY